MAGDHKPSARADERTHQPVERDVATGREASLLGRSSACLASGVAGGKDHQVRVEVQVEDLAKREQPVRAVAAETRQQRRLRRETILAWVKILRPPARPQR